MTLLDFLSSASLGGALAILLDRIVRSIIAHIEEAKTHRANFVRGDDKATVELAGYFAEYAQGFMDAVTRELEKEGFERVAEEGKK